MTTKFYVKYLTVIEQNADPMLSRYGEVKAQLPTWTAAVNKAREISESADAVFIAHAFVEHKSWNSVKFYKGAPESLPRKVETIAHTFTQAEHELLITALDYFAEDVQDTGADQATVDRADRMILLMQRLQKKSAPAPAEQ